jgi:hypothetical protein
MNPLLKGKPTQITDEELQEHYIQLNSERFDIVCHSTRRKLKDIDNKFVEEVLNTCSKARRITFKQFKVLWNFNANVIPEYRDFN